MDGLGEAVFSSLEAAFEAELVRADDEAASDFAFSLRQDRDLPDALTRSGPRLLLTPTGIALPLVEVGINYAAGGRRDRQVIVPAHLVISPAAESGPSPQRVDRTMLNVLRVAARYQEPVEVELTDLTIRGILEMAGKDHLWIRTGRDQTAVALGAVRSISLRPLGSAGVP
ncbi:MAG: hypothetical protein ABR505_00565 [Actinomycetota bacterium]